MDRSRHTVTKYLNDEKTHSAINSKTFKRLNHITDQKYEVELVKSEIEHREPIIVGFLSYNMQNWECWNFTTISFKNSVTLTSMSNLKWIPTPFTWLCPKKIWKMLFFPKNELNGISYVLKIAMIILLRMLPIIFSRELAVMSTRNMIKESQVFSKKSLDVQKCCVSVAKHIVVMINRLTSTSLPAKDSTKDRWKSVAMVDQCQSIAKC